jgi:hypothetical protein
LCNAPADVARQNPVKFNLVRIVTRKRNFFSIGFRIREALGARFSPAGDVLPFCGLFYPDHNFVSQNVEKNNMRSHPAA